jgi:60S ribosomal subunit assembly/export protein LOC1
MAPIRPKGQNKARKSATSGPSKPSSKDKIGKRPPPKQVKTKPTSITQKAKPKKPIYTDSQLKLPTINSIIPASATAAQRSGKGTGKKKNKTYVDDKESMMTILAMVNAEKEGQIESKMIKERALEEIREARRKEAEKRHGDKKEKFEEFKKEIKKGNAKGKKGVEEKASEKGGAEKKKKEGDGEKRRAKRVSFA